VRCGEWDGLVERLAELRAADAECQFFGAFRHGYQLNPPADEGVVAKAERLIGAPLPDDYRDFITTVGDGGAGPYYGLFPLAEALERADPDQLREDSPLAEDVDFRQLLDLPATWPAHFEREAADPEYAARFYAAHTSYRNPPWSWGRLLLSDCGCAEWVGLVVRGPGRGSVWHDQIAASRGILRVADDFRTWYLTWLDDTLDRIGRDVWFPAE
jgi:hypothetical protein